jgi:6-phosphogluconolactonase (cycloisomerase 2 family)
MIRRLLVVLAVALSYACGAAETPTGPPPTPAPSRADQQFLVLGYSCNYGSDDRSFSVHEIDAGAGTFRSSAFSGGSPWIGFLGVGPHRPSGRPVYATRYPAGNRSSMTMQVQSLDATGALHSVGELLLPTNRIYGPGRIESTGRFMVIGGRANSPDLAAENPLLYLHLLDDNGVPRPASTAVPGLSGMIGLEIAPNGRTFYVASTLAPPLAAYTASPDTGTIQPLPGSPYAGSGRGSFTMALHPSGRFLYTADYQTDRPNQAVWLHQIDPTTGEPRFAGSFPGDSSGDMAIDPSGRYLYLGTWTGQLWAYTIDGGSGALTPLPGYPLRPGWRAANSVSVDATGRYLYVMAEPASGSRTPSTTSVSAYRIDPGTGALTALAGFPMNPSTDACPATAVATR